MFPSSTTGEMYYPDSVVKLHEKILKDAGLKHIRFHDLRYTFATLALQNGADIRQRKAHVVASSTTSQANPLPIGGLIPYVTINRPTPT